MRRFRVWCKLQLGSSVRISGWVRRSGFVNDAKGQVLTQIRKLVLACFKF